MKLIFTVKMQHTIVMGVTTNPRTEPRDGERLPWMQQAVEPPVEPVVENPLDEQVLALLSA